LGIRIPAKYYLKNAYSNGNDMRKKHNSFSKIITVAYENNVKLWTFRCSVFLPEACQALSSLVRLGD
jgi:hypothetical protein